MNIEYFITTIEDIPEIIRMRIAYMIDDFGSITDEDRCAIETQLSEYLPRELNKSTVVFAARDLDSDTPNRIIATALLHIIEMPASSLVINGRCGEVLNVLTEPKYRGQGICSRLIDDLIAYGKAHDLARIDLSATAAGYPIYEKHGFVRKDNYYTDMRLKLK